MEPGNSDYLAAKVQGPVERILRERSYHVATQDYDRDVIIERSVVRRRMVEVTANSVPVVISGAAVSSASRAPAVDGTNIGPLNLRAYGLMIALGVLAAVWLTGRRPKRG